MTRRSFITVTTSFSSVRSAPLNCCRHSLLSWISINQPLPPKQRRSHSRRLNCLVIYTNFDFVSGVPSGDTKIGLRRLKRSRQEHYNGSLHIPTKATSEYRRQSQPRLYVGAARTSLDVLTRNCNRGVVKGGSSPRWSKRGRLTHA